jgi:hypothetical protein
VSSHEAKQLFEEAMRHVNSERDPATWNLLAGLIKLSDAVQRVNPC